jgi:amino acid adenylation domain-containing protein
MSYLLQDVFTDSATKNPDKMAIVSENGTQISYNNLNKLANQFANVIKSRKGIIRDNPFVGILSPVHIQSIAGILGTLKIGCCYVPLDEYSPNERLLHILNNTQLDTILVDPILYENHKDLFKTEQIRTVIFLDTSNMKSENIISYTSLIESSSEEPPVLNQVSDDLAYILHSSGSTGIPKGIMLTHRNARTFVDWMQKEFKLTPDDVVMSRAPFKFDLSVFDIFNTLKAGAKLVCYDWKRKREEDQRHKDYVHLMEEQKATIIYTTPSTYIVMMNRGDMDGTKLHLREIMYAGEPFPIPQLRKLQSILPHTRIANIYGPTETNIITYWWIDSIPTDDSPIPLGYEVDDTEILVVSEDNKRICNPNELGELWCRGGTVTTGYLELQEKTNECSVISPFHKFPTKFWRTGDFGYRDEQGILHYRGRKDHMVKVKGFRIELGEIESALAKQGSLDEFCVVAIPDEKYGNRLYCYYSIITGKSVTEEELISFLLTKIPTYMMPFKFIKKDILPKTSSGKIDRVVLSNEAAYPAQK